MMERSSGGRLLSMMYVELEAFSKVPGLVLLYTST